LPNSDAATFFAIFIVLRDHRKLASRAKRAAAPPASWPMLSDQELIVLLIDDCLEDQLLFQAACRRAGVPIRWEASDSPTSAFAHFDRLLSASEGAQVVWPDVVVLDLIMPGGNGTMVIEFMRKDPKLRHIPIVVLSGTPSPAILAQTAALAPDLLLPKPLFFSQLVEIVTQLYQRFGTKAADSAAKR
jgi:CheY-like chemotaxis protein